MSSTVFERHSMCSNILHVCRASPCSSAKFKQRGGDAKRPGSAALLCSSAGVSDHAGLHLVELLKQALLVESIYAFLLGHLAPTLQKHRFHNCFQKLSSKTRQNKSAPHPRAWPPTFSLRGLLSHVNSRIKPPPGASWGLSGTVKHVGFSVMGLSDM